jgi:type II secretory pathway predicted ATPase ExeA
MPQTIFSFFGLQENPFKINPDPRFLFVTEQARAAADELTYAIRTRKGLILLTGEVGTGKTMLLRRLLDWLSEQKMPTALIFNSHIKPDHLLDLILNDFGVPCASNLKSEKLIALNRWLLERYRAGQTPVLIVDEAQGLEPTALEEIRLLLNFETPREKLLQIVLAGQPELEIKLKRHELRQLRQRITIRCRTAPLALEQTYGYIRERLRVVGGNAALFESDAIGSIHAYSRGIPRIINVLCEHSLINACADGAHTISSATVERAARECQLDRTESIARILNTGSYSTTTLSEIGSILNTVSAGSDSAARPLSQQQFSEALPAAPQDRYHDVQPQPATASTTAVTGRKVPQEQKEDVGPNDLPLAATTARPIEEPSRKSQTPAARAGSEITQRPLRRSRLSLVALLRLWGTSFVDDARTTSRQFRRVMHSFEIRWWKPVVRDLRRTLHQLRIHASRVASDPRAVSTSQACWRVFKSSMPPWLSQQLNTHQTETRSHVASSRAARRRTIGSLRRWLHEPLTNQRKRARGNQHRS